MPVRVEKVTFNHIDALDASARLPYSPSRVGKAQWVSLGQATPTKRAYWTLDFAGGKRDTWPAW